MDFFQYFSFISSSSKINEPLVAQNKIIINIDRYSKFIFSLGTYQGERDKQLFFPFFTENCDINNSIVFGIDTEYKIDHTQPCFTRFTRINDTSLKFKQMFVLNNIQCFYELDKNIQLYIISHSIKTDYNTFKSEALECFSRTLDCETFNEDWLCFYRLLEFLIRYNKLIYINNWVYTNSRYFKTVDGKLKSYYRDIGHYFEYFPEIGYILNQLYGCWFSRNNIKIYITSFNNKVNILPIQSTKLSIL